MTATSLKDASLAQVTGGAAGASVPGRPGDAARRITGLGPQQLQGALTWKAAVT